MKLIIDIPEEKYNEIEPFLDGKTIKGGFNLFNILEIVKNGTPLDKLIDDIQCKIMHESCYIPDASEAVGMSKAIGIIEKYTKECEE